MKKIIWIVCVTFAIGFVFSGIAGACGGGECQGCTPGYWKQPQHFDSWEATGYSPYDNFDTVFGVDAFYPDVTLLEALNLKGGGLNALARQAVASLLNAASPDVNFWSKELVIQYVQTAIGFGEEAYEIVKNLAESYNELGCPLD